MRTRTIISVFGLAVCLVGVCAPAGFRLPYWKQTAKAEPINPPATFVSALEDATLNPALLALIREQDKQEENLFAPIDLTASDSSLHTSENKIEGRAWVPKQKTVQS